MRTYMSKRDLIELSGCFNMKKVDYAVPLSMWSMINPKTGEKAISDAFSYYGPVPQEIETPNRPFVDFAGGVLIWLSEAEFLFESRNPTSPLSSDSDGESNSDGP